MNLKAAMTTDRLIMVRPVAFGFNPETANNNSFQKNSDRPPGEIQSKALYEFDLFVQKLRNHRIHVDVIEDLIEVNTPDAIFPNNWISLHADGSVVTYPMFSRLRRHERRKDLLLWLEKKYNVTNRITFEQYEVGGRFLEGTGSMILDRKLRIVYGCRSIRTDELILDKFCKKLGFTKVIFNAFDENNTPIYHTNVIMALGEKFAVICLESIPDGIEKLNLVKNLEHAEKSIIDISYGQVNSFAGNMLQVVNKDKVSYTIMSEAAFMSLKSEQIDIITKSSFIIHSAIPTIELIGGGSVRCMMAENFLTPTLLEN